MMSDDDELLRFEKPDQIVNWFDMTLEHIRGNPERYRFPKSDFEKVFDYVLAVDYRQKKWLAFESDETGE